MAENGATADEDVTVCLRRHSEYYLMRLRRFDARYQQGGGAAPEALSSLDEDWEQIRQGRLWALKHLGLEPWATGLSLGYSLAGAPILSWRLLPSERLDWLNPGLRGARDLHDPEAEADLWEEMAKAHGRSSDWKTAVDDYWESWRLWRDLANREREGRCLGKLGLAYVALGDRAEARHALEKALAIDRETGDRLAEGRHLGSLGLASEGEEARRFFFQALEIAREVGDRRGELSHLGCLGAYWLERGDVAEGARGRGSVHPNVLMRNLRPDGSLPEHLQETVTAQDAGACTRKAMGYFEKALAIAREMADRPGEATHLGNLGNSWLRLGRIARGIQLFDEALKISREIGEIETEIRQLHGLRSAYRILHDEERVLEIEQALRENLSSTSGPGKDDLADMRRPDQYPRVFDGELRKVSAEEPTLRYWSEYYAIHIGE